MKTGAFPNRLVRATRETAETSYAYDGEGRRVQKVAGAATTVYVYDGLGQLAAEYGAPAAEGGTRYLTADHLGSTRLVTDAAGGVKERLDYLPFGEEIPRGFNGRSSEYPSGNYADIPRVNTIELTGKERDSETGLDYFGARYFSGAQGRFTSPDIAAPRLEDPQSFNSYAHTRNNPLRRIDPDGRYDIDVHLSLTWALAEAAGFSNAEAFGIAAADQGVDDNPNTSPGFGSTERQRQANRDWHFPTEGRLSELATSTVENLTETSVGQYMHVFQDSFSHAGYTDMVWGHAKDLKAPDHTWLRPELANRMAEGTYANLVAAGGALGAKGVVVPWEQIAGHVNRFNRASNQRDKDKALEALRQAIAKYVQQWEEARRKQEERKRRQGRRRWE